MKNSSGAVLSKINSNGNISTPNLVMTQGSSNTGKVVVAGAVAAYTYPSNKSYVYLTANTPTIALTFPAPANDGQIIAFTFGVGVTRATYIPTAPATGIIGASAIMAANTPQHFIYDSGTSSWYPY